MRPPPAVLRRLLIGLMLLFGLPAWAGNTLFVDADTTRLDTWPALRMLADPTLTLSAAEILSRTDRFQRPQGTNSNLGINKDAVWLRVPVTVAPGTRPDWVLHIDYAPLNRVDLFVVQDGRITAQHRMGNSLPFAERPLPSRAHAAPLTLLPGTQELLLRVETRSSMVLPITLLSTTAFIEAEANAQMLQGLLTGLALCMLIYSLAQWVNLRDAVFLEYAVFVGGTALFLLSYFGLAQQYLWPNSPGWSMQVAPLAVLVATAAGSRFISRTLAVPEVSRPIGHALQALGWAAALAAVGSIAGLTDYRVTQALATVFGPLCVLLA
ncbi:MAG: 7TM-DISM domain-containing protein, partial [Rubrivivax sp.]|nr:7TM-DISM domain-containing protein [Rubrivivax sp.]